MPLAPLKSRFQIWCDGKLGRDLGTPDAADEIGGSEAELRGPFPPVGVQVLSVGLSLGWTGGGHDLLDFGDVGGPADHGLEVGESGLDVAPPLGERPHGEVRLLASLLE